MGPLRPSVPGLEMERAQPAQELPGRLRAPHWAERSVQLKVGQVELELVEQQDSEHEREQLPPADSPAGLPPQSICYWHDDRR